MVECNRDNDKKDSKENDKGDSKLEWILCIGLLIGASILGMDTNHNPMLWANRIFPPIEKGTGTIYWGGILLLVLIYNVFRKIYSLKKWHIFNKRWKCFVWTWVFIYFVSNINPEVVQTIKRMETGLGAIYLDREALMGFNFDKLSEDGTIYNQAEENETMTYKTEGYITLINCSNQEVGPFKIKIIVPEGEEYPIEEFTSGEDYYLNPRERRTIKLNFEGVLDEKNKLVGEPIYILGKKFEVVLWNNKEQVKFLPE